MKLRVERKLGELLKCTVVVHLSTALVYSLNDCTGPNIYKGGVPKSHDVTLADYHIKMGNALPEKVGR